MKELIDKMVVMNTECARVLKSVESREMILSQLVISMIAIKDAVNEVAAEIILLKEEVERNGKGEI
jgi:hypothetical protein